ncbi:aspartate-semialdehyde dehydrogenase [Thermodesulfovibrio thiophilus]|uniref:aspartate-semialdehyde dehydrogenase n=1 Tax=Thermodesulfovibrio thiophilus TaxID=340095 RepID=UPI00184A2D0B|nr:aspartate-semialdehyde dehydrogenase [Thermodesulfovibrio thiophilus]HHW20646.1 aspartate-semialdehyde dehydrogenase [Thermodesulfovibrio thiophilus]
MLKKKERYNVAVVGATGAVGNEMISVLEEREFPVENLSLFASERSEGTKLSFNGYEIPVETLKEDSFVDIDIALFSAGAERSKIWAPIAAKSGCVVIDNSSQWRMNAEVPLVVPEVNAHDLKWHKGIIANPNCSTIQMVVVLKPIHDVAKIKRVVVTTFQAVSGTGKKAMDELLQQTVDLLNFKDITIQVYPHQIAFNVLPHIDKFLENGYTKEEMKMVNETQKIMGDSSIRVTATTVRVPVFRGHSESVNVETEKKITAHETRELLSKAPGVVVMDNPEKNEYPLPIYASGRDEVFVGRIRDDESIENGINLWVVSDNLRKGAALNAVQIAEELIRMV